MGNVVSKMLATGGDAGRCDCPLLAALCGGVLDTCATGTVGRLTAAAARAAAAATLDAVGAAASAAPLAARAAASAAWWPASRLAAASSAGAGAAAWALGMLLAGAEVEVRAWRGGVIGDGQRALALRAAAHMSRRPSARPCCAADPAQPKPASARARPAADATEPAVARPLRDNLLLRLLDMEDEQAAMGAKCEKAIRALNAKLEDLGGQLAIAEAGWAAAEAACVAAQREAATEQRELHTKLAAADAARVAAQRDAAFVRDWAAGKQSELQELRRQLAEACAGRAAAEEAAANSKAYLAFMRATACGAATY